MELTLYVEDLKDEYKTVGARATRFYMFKANVRTVISLVGRAVYREWFNGRESYNAIFPGMLD